MESDAVGTPRGWRESANACFVMHVASARLSRVRATWDLGVTLCTVDAPTYRLEFHPYLRIEEAASNVRLCGIVTHKIAAVIGELGRDVEEIDATDVDVHAF
jgi:hypothetical protein